MSLNGHFLDSRVSLIHQMGFFDEICNLIYISFKLESVNDVIGPPTTGHSIQGKISAYLKN